MFVCGENIKVEPIKEEFNDKDNVEDLLYLQQNENQDNSYLSDCVICNVSKIPMNIIAEDIEQNNNHELNNVVDKVEFNNMDAENNVIDNSEDNENKVDVNVAAQGNIDYKVLKNLCVEF